MEEQIEETPNQPQQLFIRADEVDAGTTILSPSDQLPLSALSPADSSGPAGTARGKPPSRPGLRREGSSAPPPPPSQPPPAPPPPGDVTDSLSLPQLRQLVSQFPKTEQRAYAFQYKEAEDFEKEVDEWFQYTEPEQEREYLLASREAFEQKWKVYCQHQLHTDDASWMEVEQDVRQKFMRDIIPDLEGSDMNERIEALGCVYYILTGTWSITSGLDTSKLSEEFKNVFTSSSDQFNAVQLEWMHRGADLVVHSSLTSSLYGALFTAAKPSASTRESSEDIQDQNDQTFDDDEYRELSLCFSCFYLLIESGRARAGKPEGERIRQEITALSPSFLLFLTGTISRLRWDESYNIPLIHAIQLVWKSILLLFGDIQHSLEDVKGDLQPRVDPFSAEASHPVLTASPLDYHLFRQEITSKYPAYNPPLPLIPLEVEQKSIIPLMPQYSSRQASRSNGSMDASSILHQPVHIATPAPSPPPSPIGPGGKTGKKQNYQTNQNFPFLYPPLDSSSNDLGGKGNTELQDLMTGKKWEGSDVPTSIIEAGELFASRMRMTRAMRQLWKQRDLFMKYDRGWRGDEKPKSTNVTGSEPDEAEDEELDGLNDPNLRSRMHAVEHFFHHALPDMQSFVIVLMKIMLSNVQDIAIRNGNFTDPNSGTNGLHRSKSNSNVTAQTLPMPPPPPKPTEMSIEDLDNIRSREISQKAISATLFLLLKWFKISHILKFEYLTQLLLDSNYVQLTLKYFAHQNLEDLVAFGYDRDDLSFFHYCHLHSDHPPLSPTSPKSHSSSSQGSSLDDAIPPPIARHRRSSGTTSTEPPVASLSPESISHHPTVDELGHPHSPTSFPPSPITQFSFRQFHTSIHLLRVLQKLTRHKSHRILLLVQFKSSQILRRILRVPDPTLRLYVLKLFKSQVPYCGRKWRQSNMRVITAIYLHCRPELRDEWLAGMHESSVEGEVEESVPVEWAGRGLAFWWLKRMYPREMMLREHRTGGELERGEAKLETDEGGRRGEEEEEGGGRETDLKFQEIEDDERDFFQRELDLLGWGMAALSTSGASDASMAGGGEVAFGEEAATTANGVIYGMNHGIVNGGGGGGGYGDVGGEGGRGGGGQWENANVATLEAWQNQ